MLRIDNQRARNREAEPGADRGFSKSQRSNPVRRRKSPASLRLGGAGAFIVWRITAKKRMAAKLKAIKAELQRRKHHRTTEVGAWLRKVVWATYQYHAVPGNSTQLRIFSVALARCGGAYWFVAVNAHRCDGIVSILS